jgi:hypothetical protein
MAYGPSRARAGRTTGRRRVDKAVRAPGRNLGMSRCPVRNAAVFSSCTAGGLPRALGEGFGEKGGWSRADVSPRTWPVSGRSMLWGTFFGARGWSRNRYPDLGTKVAGQPNQSPLLNLGGLVFPPSPPKNVPSSERIRSIIINAMPLPIRYVLFGESRSVF